MVWCIAIPLQHVDSLRKRSLTLHRLNGYTALTASFTQTVSGVPFLIYGYASSHKKLLHIHYLSIRGNWKRNDGRNSKVVGRSANACQAKNSCGDQREQVKNKQQRANEESQKFRTRNK
ncbi:hypothetical protein CRV24_004208 [Beauveria bassiana]|nr:hypothetical protein CRV24_004208 [Beauveria bassiana]KAH8710822.1 hypothetical protein HC256_007652 [Beauveria bassiana]